MHVGIELDERWLRAARTKGLPPVIHSIPDRHDPRVLATRLGVELNANGALVGQLADSHAIDENNLNYTCDFRDRLDSSETILLDSSDNGWTAAGLLAVCLRNLYRNVVAMSDGTWDSATLTIPAGRSNAFRENVLEAMELADLPNATLLEEPFAAWWYVKHGDAAPDPSMVIDIGDISSSVSILHGHLDMPQLATTAELKSSGKRFVLDKLARDLASPIFRQYFPPAAEEKFIVADVLRQIQLCGIDTLDSRKVPARYHWLIQGRICEVLLLSDSLTEARRTLIDPLKETIRGVMRQCELQPRTFQQILLTRNSSRFPELVNWIKQEFPDAQIRGTERNGEWMHAFGAALVSPQHPAWNPVPARTFRRDRVHADLGFKIWNPVENRTDLDVLFPTNSSVPQRVERHYRPILAESSPFITLELAERGQDPTEYLTFARWDVPLKSRQEQSHVTVSVDLVTPSQIELSLQGDMIAGTETMRVFDLSSDLRTFRLSEQRKLLDGLSFIES